MDKQELDKYRNKVWINITDVQHICGIGYEKAKRIINEINNMREGKYYIPNRNEVPSQDLFKFLGI